MRHIGRKIYHLLGGLIFIALYVKLGRTSGLIMLSGIFLLATAVDLARLKIQWFNQVIFKYFSKFIRESERNKLTGTPPYLLGMLLSVALYDLPVAVYAVIFLACGDVAATTVGERWGSVKLAGGKSLQGTLAFFLTSAILGLAISRVLYPVSPWVILSGAAVAAAVEVVPLGVDDNLTVPVISGGVMWLLLRGGF